jgi:hypothetical protein
MFDYRLDDRDSISDGDKNFASTLCVQTSSEAHAASYPMGTEGKARPERDATPGPTEFNSCRFLDFIVKTKNVFL